MLDLFKIQRYYSQTEFVAYQATQMLQTISQNRSDKKITATDLQNIYTAATLSIYPTTDFSTRKGGHKWGHFPEITLFYVESDANGIASVVWLRRVDLWNYGGVRSSPSEVLVENSNARSMVNALSNVEPSAIYPRLSMSANDKKIIVEAKIGYSTSSKYCFDNGVTCNNISPRNALGLYLVSPKALNNNRYSEDCGYFNSVVIFSPNLGLFDSTAPS